MEKRTKEWLLQADYDLDSARYLHQGGRHIYAVFMCHLAVEKALKGWYFEKRREFPPKSHNLVFLLNEIAVVPPEVHGRFVVRLSGASIPTRYPEDLARMRRDFTGDIVGEILSGTREVVSWIKAQL